MSEEHADSLARTHVVNVGSADARLETLADLIRGAAGHHGTFLAAVECALNIAFTGLIEDLARQQLWWADMGQAHVLASQYAERLLGGAHISTPHLALVGLAADVALTLANGEEPPGRLSEAYYAASGE